MSTPMPQVPAAWEQRLRPLVTVVPYVLLAVLVLLTVILKRTAGMSLIVDLALSAAMAVWMLWMITLHPAWRGEPRMMAIFLAVLIVPWAILVIRDPWYGFFTPAGYFYAYRLIRWPGQLLAVSAVAVVAGTAQLGGLPAATGGAIAGYLGVLAANVLPMCGLSWVIRRGDQHDDQREQALFDVSEANRRLQASLAENAGLQRQLMAQAREAGVLDERQRMAREIHDTLAQGLTGIIAQLQAAEQVGDDPAQWHRHVVAATTLARESLSAARRSVHALRPQQLEASQLSDAIADVAGRWSALHGIAVQVTTTGTQRPMSPESEFALLRTAQEALANVAKHAQAMRVGVTLSYLDDQVALDVRDDGRGFDPVTVDTMAPRESGGFGLVAMRQRIESLAGTLQIESEPGGGTGISACVPVEATV